ncbi:MAG: PKD domain-containing protein [Flavobacteriales bacterium]|nr:PKD domain-containing protein [Flavobacteriales bacterium]
MRNHAPRRTMLAALMAAALGTLAQGTIWHFGDGAGLDFNGGAPAAIGGGASYSLDNSTTASDAAGNLLFYSNGVSVWDATHNVMPNGSGLLGDHDGGQCALAVHRPGTNEFYLFTVDNWNGPNGLRYSVVDMTLNGGLGDVTLKNQLLHAPSTERLEAVHNPTDGSWWLISHDWGNAQFRAYNISNTGLNTTPVLSTIGSVHSGFNYDAAGQLTASPNGTMLCCGIYDQDLFQVFDFDATTGIVSNARDLPGYNNAWGCAFSPNSERLYLTKWFDNEVHQVDLTAGTWSIVQASDMLVGNTSGNVGGYQAGYLQLGPDGKVYVAKFGQSTIAAINSPNALGTGCGFVDNAVSLGAGICNAGLCRSPMDDGPECTFSVTLSPAGGCAGQLIEFTATVLSGSPSSWQWSFSDGGSSNDPQNTTHTFSEEGVYILQLIVSEVGNACVDTAEITFTILAPGNAGLDTAIAVCKSDVLLSLNDLLSPDADPNGSWYLPGWTPTEAYFHPAIVGHTIIAYVISGNPCGPDTAYVDVEVKDCVGIETWVGPSGSLSPIPADEVLTFTTPTPRWFSTFTVIDALGQVVLSITQPNGVSDTHFDVRGLSDGQYCLLATDGSGGRSCYRFIVQHR